MSTNKQEIFDAFDGKDIGRTLSGFWFHFSPKEDLAYSVGNADVLRTSLEGHRRYCEALEPEIFKIMSDDYFTPTNALRIDVGDADALAALAPLPEDDAWFTEQIELAKAISAQSADRSLTLYTMFSPLSSLFYSHFAKFGGTGDAALFAESAKRAPQSLKHALDVMTGDLIHLAERLYRETNIDGIFFSTRTYEGISKETYRQLVQESDRAVLYALNAKSDYNILHICGYTGSRNDLELYRAYPAKVYNWDVHVENLSIGQGKEFFGGKTVLGGFNNRPNTLLHSGSKEDILTETRRLIKEAGPSGFVLGADCTLPNDIAFERLQWVREAGLR
ncbi:MAG: hypothetical protein LBS24_02095 [Clostridiales Family XIII bacterium]|jgi:uroporphyrinogen decarboxylase|nr:hypothetical protein [Clostridiales Family XIII bacterium]